MLPLWRNSNALLNASRTSRLAQCEEFARIVEQRICSTPSTSSTAVSETSQFLGGRLLGWQNQNFTPRSWSVRGFRSTAVESVSPYSRMEPQETGAAGHQLLNIVEDKRKHEQVRMLERQIELELEAVETASERYKRMAEETAGRGTGSELPVVKQLFRKWYPKLVVAVKEEQAAIEKGEFGVDRSAYGPYLRLLDAEQLAVIVLHTTMSALMKGDLQSNAEKPRGSGGGGAQNRRRTYSAPGTTKIVRLVNAIGDVVQAQGAMSTLERRAKMKPMTVKEDRGEEVLDEELQGELGKEAEAKSQAKAEKMVRDAETLGEIRDRNDARNKARNILRQVKMYSEPWRRAAALMAQEDWGLDIRCKVGAAMINLLIGCATIEVRKHDWSEPEETAAFVHAYRQQVRGRNYGVLEWHEQLAAMMESEHARLESSSNPRYLPMLIPPRPWTAYNDGAYITIPSMVMRGNYSRAGPSSKQVLELKKYDEMLDGRPSPVYEAINVLGAQGWATNKAIMAVIREVWEEGGGLVGLPSQVVFPVPDKPRPKYQVYRKGGTLVFGYAVSPDEAKRARRLRDSVRQKNSDLYSLRCDFEYKLNMADRMAEEEAFYLPHNMDFRGRAYPLHPHLNHMGGDVTRGTLVFADAKPLGKDGLFWLMVHLANKYGNGADKLALDKRVGFVESQLGDIIDSAALPTKGRRWWMEADEPWQCLAACLELHRALLSPDPSTFMSSLPVHQDGSCNGLQHYAALGRDLIGGAAVNLTPGPQPADVYTGIADLVRIRVESDSTNPDLPAATRELATLLLPLINRKLVKQTVMTSVYGVTFVGARQQIQNRLKERGAFEDQGLPDPEDVQYKVAGYAAKRTLQGLDQMFVSARKVMEWLARSAAIAASCNGSDGGSVRWETPLGLPIVQPYRKKGRKVVRTVVQSFVVQFDNDAFPVVKQKQRSAFPPNYIHSLDSAHMMMTALSCNQRGLGFAGVHDSFWSHAGSVTEMNEVIREEFVKLHSEPLLQNLKQSLMNDFPEVAKDFEDPPPIGDLDLEKVKESVYFFS